LNTEDNTWANNECYRDWIRLRISQQ